MSANGPTGSDDEREVLSSLPRSRRQRPTARREAARAQRSTTPGTKPKTAKKAPAKAKAKAGTTAAAKPAAKRKPAAKPKATAVAAAPAKAKVKRPKRTIPPAGYATPRAKGDHGSADPGAAIAGVVRSVLKRIPRP